MESLIAEAMDQNIEGDGRSDGSISNHRDMPFFHYDNRSRVASCTTSDTDEYPHPPPPPPISKVSNAYGDEEFKCNIDTSIDPVEALTPKNTLTPKNVNGKNSNGLKKWLKQKQVGHKGSFSKPSTDDVGSFNDTPRSRSSSQHKRESIVSQESYKPTVKEIILNFEGKGKKSSGKRLDIRESKL
jgi:hypothetical protein